MPSKLQKLEKKAELSTESILNNYKSIAYHDIRDYYEINDNIITIKSINELTPELAIRARTIDKLDSGDIQITFRTSTITPIDELTPEQAAAIQSIEQTQDGRFKLKFYNKLEASRDLGKYFGLFNKFEFQHTGPNGGPIEVTDPIRKRVQEMTREERQFALERLRDISGSNSSRNGVSNANGNCS